MKKILINGGGYADIPLIQAAKELGYFVITTGNRINDKGHFFSDKYIHADFSDSNAILELVKKEKVNYIVPACNDYSIITASQIEDVLENKCLDNFKTTKIIHHKNLFRKFSIDHDIPSPKAFTLHRDSLTDIPQILQNLGLSYPLIVKPIDLTGGKGVAVVQNFSQLQQSVNTALTISKEDQVVIEEFIAGEHFSAFLFIYKKEIKISFFAKEYYSLNKFLVAGAYSFMHIDYEIQSSIKQHSNKIIETLDLRDGLFHIQFIIKDNIPYFIEVTRRSPGDLYLELVSNYLDINISQLIVKSHTCGLNETDFLHKSSGLINKKCIVRHCVMANKNGIFKNLIFSPNIQIKSIYPIKTVGEKVEDYLTEKIAIAFLEVPQEEAENIDYNLAIKAQVLSK